MPEFKFLWKFEKNEMRRCIITGNKYLPKPKESIKIQENVRKNKEYWTAIQS